jgi:pimeloyl-ACP methyl ester carboxylesterase
MDGMMESPSPHEFVFPGDVRPERVPTPRGPVEVAAFGAGPVALCLHGAMGGFDQGLLLARTVAIPGLRYVAPSRPGYLGTPLAAGRTPAEQAELCALVLDALGHRDALVMAVSGGGPAAVEFALRHPERCRGLVLVSSCTARLEGPMPLAWYLFRLIARIPALGRVLRPDVDADPDRAVRRSIPDPALRAATLRHPEAGPLLLALQRSTGDRLPLRIAGAENDVRMTRRDLRLDLERLAVPALAIHGTADRVVPFAQARAFAARAPGAELYGIEGGDHVALFTHLEEFRARVHRFVAGRVRSA